MLRSKRSNSFRHCDSGYTVINTRDLSFNRIGRTGLSTPFSNTARKASPTGMTPSQNRYQSILVVVPSSGQATSDAKVQPSRFELVVNLKTAKVLELTIPQSILIRADQVIQ